MAAYNQLPKLPTIPKVPSANQQQLANAYAAFHPQLGPVGAYPTPDLTPEDVNYFDTAHRQANQAWGHGSAQQNFTSADQLAQHNQQLAALQQRFDEVRRRLPGQFINRGVGQSGIAAQGYQDYNRDRTQGFGQENMRYNSMVGQNKITQDQLNDVWVSTGKDIDAQRAARQQTILAAWNARKA